MECNEGHYNKRHEKTFTTKLAVKEQSKKVVYCFSKPPQDGCRWKLKETGAETANLFVCRKRVCRNVFF